MHISFYFLNKSEHELILTLLHKHFPSFFLDMPEMAVEDDVRPFQIGH